MADRVWYLQNCRLCEQLSASELARLEARARLRKFPKNSSIYLPRDQADCVYVVAEGRVRLTSITREGKQAILAMFGPGDLFGELAIAGATEREDYAEAAENSTIVSIPRDALEPILAANPAMSLAVTKLIGWRRRRLERRLRNLLFCSNRERLVALLWDLLEQYRRRVDDGWLIDIKLSHQELANLIGVTRESVTLALGELQTEGMISIGRQRIVIRNLDQLARAADERIPAEWNLPQVRPGEPKSALRSSG
jgi:CRP-like cAMP-binding protein